MKIGDLHRIYDTTKDRVRFLTVYISEAHAGDARRKAKRGERGAFDQPKTFAQRKELADVLVKRLGYRIPLAIDAMDDRAQKAFAAWPDRIYLIGPGGRVLYKGNRGQFGFHPEKAEKVLAAFLAMAPPGPPSNPAS